MTEEIKDKLDEEIQSLLEDLSNFDSGSEDYKHVLDDVTKLIDKRNDIDKIELEIDKQRLNEVLESRKSKNEEELNVYNKKQDIIKHAISIGSIVIPVFLTVWGTYKTLKFEETGTVTTIMGRGFVNKLIPKK